MLEARCRGSWNQSTDTLRMISFDRCRHVSDEDMQALWATLIAGANNPGSFSTRAVDIVATLDKRDLGLIAEAAKFCISGKDYGQIIYRIPEYLFSKGLTFEKLIELENMGILSGVQVANLSFRYAFESHGNDSVVPLNYANKKVMVIHKNEKTDADHTLTLPAGEDDPIPTRLDRIIEAMEQTCRPAIRESVQ